MEKLTLYVVYLIGESVDTGYVGVTCNKIRRWTYHAFSKYPVGEYIRKNDLKFSENSMQTLYEGTAEQCFQLEIKLRPDPLMGLNVAPGGQGGLRVYTKERNAKISNALKGRKHTWGQKVSATKKLRGSAIGEKNPRAKQWKFISPFGEEFIVCGNKQKFCDERQLLASCLVYHLGNAVPPISQSSKRGGFRAKNKNSLHRRLNSVGWILESLQ